MMSKHKGNEVDRGGTRQTLWNNKKFQVLYLIDDQHAGPVSGQTDLHYSKHTNSESASTIGHETRPNSTPSRVTQTLRGWNATR